MARRTSPRNDRFAARLPRIEKALLQRAADLHGVPLSTYVFEKARLAAARDLAEAGELVLAPKAQRQFVDLVLAPPQPTAALTTALKGVRRAR